MASSAALNLISYKPEAGKPSPSIQTATQGIYGRPLFRPSDLNNGTPPSIAPGGYTAAAGTAHVTSIIHRDPRKDGQGGTAFGQIWDVFNRLHLRHSKGSQRTFYISVDSFGSDKPISAQGSGAYFAWHENYDARRDGFFTIDFDLEAGDYDLAMQSECAFWESPKRYEGWQSTSLAFFLHGLSTERL